MVLDEVELHPLDASVTVKEISITESTDRKVFCEELLEKAAEGDHEYVALELLTFEVIETLSIVHVSVPLPELERCLHLNLTELFPWEAGIVTLYVFFPLV
tara:strand:+ start:362 stop:664 length:303 start_codon:yes stop_codon:yes gene_type:complete